MFRSNVNSDILSPVSLLQRSASVYPEREAVVYGEHRYTYREFQARVFQLANALLDQGVVVGDKVVFICPNTPPLLEAHFAIPMIGAVLVCVNTQLSSGEYRYIIDHSDAKVLFIDNEFADQVHPIIDELKNLTLVVNIYDDSFTQGLEGPEYEVFIACGATTLPQVSGVDDENAMISINYTSGTTGMPKGAMYSHRSTYLHTMGEIIESSLESDSVYLWTLPMFHCNGWSFPWAVTGVGATHVCMRHCQPKEIFKLIESENVSHMCAAPNVLLMMICYPEARHVKLRRSLKVLSAGASPSPAIIQGMEEIGANITHVYGLTELHGPHSVCAWQPDWVELDPEAVSVMKSRQGVPYITSMHMDVIDPLTGERVAEDGESMGEVVMRGNNVMLGYYKDEDATEKVFRGGFFHSGDIGVVHSDGYIQIMDRVSDIIVRGGNKISSIEIENVIYQHPDVLEVAVVSTPDPIWGEVPKAFVVPKLGKQPTAEDIITFCRENHAQYKVPQIVEFRQLPKTATGKTMKAKLRYDEWEGRDRKVS